MWILQAEIQQVNRRRAVQAANRQNRVQNGDWLRGDPIPVIEGPEDIIEEEPEDILVEYLMNQTKLRNRKTSWQM